MNAKIMDDLSTATTPWYKFYVRNANGFFSDSEWQNSPDFEYIIGDEDEMCELINPSAAQSDIYSIYNWEFAIQVKDSNNMNPAIDNPVIISHIL